MDTMVNDGRKVEAGMRLGEGHLRFIAENIIKERTGIHARLSIAWNSTLLAYSTFNIERDTDRTTLVNKAYPALPAEIKAICPKDDFKHELDLFTFRLWDTFLSHLAAEQLDGDLSVGQAPFVLFPYIQEGAGTIVFGPPGRGKSYVLKMMAVSVDSGESEWWETALRSVVFVNLERSRQSVMYRLARVNLCLGYPATRSLWMLNARGHTLVDVRDAIRKVVEEHGVEVVFLDSISRAGMGDLTGNREANAIIDVLNNVAPTWVAIGHTPRQDDSHLFGGVHFDAGADIMVKLASEATPTSLGIALEITKANDSGKPRRPEHIALDFEEKQGLIGIRRPGAAEFSNLSLGTKLSFKEEVASYLLDVGEATASTIAQGIGRNRSNIAHLLSQDKSFVWRRRTPQGVLYALSTPEHQEARP